MQENTVIQTDIQKEKIKAMINNIYGIQKMRVQCGNRLVASFMGFGEKSRNRTQDSVKKELEEKDSNIEDAETTKKLKKLLSEYNRVTDAIVEQAKAKNTSKLNITKSNISKAINTIQNSENKLEFIGEVYDYKLINTYESLLDIETKAVAALADEVKRHPMWDRFFVNVRGCGPMMAAVCLAYFDVYKARHASSFWKYAGLDVVTLEDGTTEGRCKKHTEKQPYIDKNGEIKEKIGITYNPILKSKLLGVLGSSFIKSAKKDGVYVGYGKIYYDYKNRLDNRLDMKDISNLRKHRMAVRYAVKQFVRDLWVDWRTYEGLEVSEPYEVAKLGYKPHGYMGLNIEQE